MEQSLNFPFWLISNFKILSGFNDHFQNINPSKLMIFKQKTFFFNLLCLFIVKEYYTHKEVKEKERPDQYKNNKEISIVGI